MTRLHETRIKRHYEMLYGLWYFNKDNKEFLDHESESGKSNENIIADHIIAPITWSGSFNKGWYSFEAIENLFLENKKIKTERCTKNQIDHVIKTKQIARAVWYMMGKEINCFEDFKNFLVENVMLCTITKKQNKDMDSRTTEFCLDRYVELGIEYIYIKKNKIFWKKIDTMEDLLSNFEKVEVEKLLR